MAALTAALPVESDLRVREAIFTGLVRIGTPESARAILPYIRSDDANMRTGALDALRAMPEAVKPHLAALLQDQDADVRLLSCEIARNLPTGEATGLLCALLDAETEGNVCATAVDVLAEIGAADCVRALMRCAARFPDDPFLGFAVKVAADRLRSRATGQ
ncbi:MAG: HEAT repeat domain-containing protein [Stellaceae bacterium]